MVFIQRQTFQFPLFTFRIFSSICFNGFMNNLQIVKYEVHLDKQNVSQLTFTCSKSTIETLENMDIFHTFF